MRISWLVMIVVAVAKASDRIPEGAQPTPSSEFAVVGYLPEYRYGSTDVAALFSTGLTHLIFFSLEIDGVRDRPTTLERLPPPPLMKAAKEAAAKVGGKLLLGFGGNARSQGFAEMTSTPVRRRRFLSYLNVLLLEHGFDGVDYNWEYPADFSQWGKWSKLIEESKRALLNGSAVVTFAIYQDPRHVDMVMRMSMLKYADLCHVMAYDAPGKHSTFDFYADGIHMLAHRGVAPMAKMTMGLPFYARHVQTGEAKTYAELASQITRRDVDEVGPFYLNGVATLRKKTQYAQQAGLGGVMIWEVGQDIQPCTRPKSLMRGVQSALNPIAKPSIPSEDL